MRVHHVAAVLLLGAAVQASAQSLVSIRGVVRDPQGGAIARATVDVRCGAERRQLTVSPDGDFTAAGLPPGRCSVIASSPSFEPSATTVESGGSEPVTLVLQVPRYASEVVVTPGRGQGVIAFDVPETLSVTTRRDIDSRPYTVLAQALREEPGVLVQQTTSAQVSPIIRGFTGQSNIYLVDGVRLNTGTWRSGPSQYLAWVDGGPVNTIEVVRGGGSVQYGSDALGGTLQLRTMPSLFAAAPLVQGDVELSGATADRSVTAQGQIGFRVRSAFLRAGASRQSVGDLRAGGGKDSHAAVTRFLGLPSSVIGSRLPDTSFDQSGAYVIADAAAAQAVVHGLYLHGDQNGASRYDRIMGGEGLFRSGFEPQTLHFGLLRYSRPQVAGLSGVSGTFSVNRQADGRFEQARPNARLDRQEATTTALGYQVQASREFGARHQFLAGAEFYDESTSAKRQLVEISGLVTASRPDLPDGTDYTNLGIFAQHTAVVVPDRLSVKGGVRYGRFRFATTPDPVLGVTAEEELLRTVTFQTAAVIKVNDALNLTANVTRGFRAPNAADFGSIGLTGGGGFEITPSKAAALGAIVGSTGGTNAVSTGEAVSGLRPEVAYQYEAGAKVRFGAVSAALNAFDMELYDFIQRRSLVFGRSIVGTNISGFDVVRQDAAGLAYIPQDIRPIATRVNIDRGRVLGFDVEAEIRVTSAWTASGYYSMANGKLLATSEPIRRMPPPMGGARLRWSGVHLWAEGVLTFAAEQTRLNSGDLTDARIGAVRTAASIATFFNGTATDIGLVQNGRLVATNETLAQVQARVLGGAASAPLYTREPGYAVVGLRGGVQLSPHLDVTVIGENLGDINYRFYGSGLDAPGANLQVRTRYRF